MGCSYGKMKNGSYLMGGSILWAAQSLWAAPYLWTAQYLRASIFKWGGSLFNGRSYVMAAQY